MDRTPEPDTFSPSDEAAEYHAMDHSAVNRQFVDELLEGPTGPLVLDLGCGPAGIPIELCQRSNDYEVIATDGEVEMLEIAKQEIDIAGCLGQISLSHVAVESMEQFEDGMADTVISNSLLHHLEEPRAGLETAVRLTRDGGRIFIRDLARPETEAEIESMVQAYSGSESENGQQLFRQSLHAALTLNEIRLIARGLGIPEDDVQMSSDRHWTIDWCRTS
ncbi:MAG: methyltransferase domain-containing protein [Planctomycetaceae bacterium]|nr:methyltransferase domain-containing protein [Planctomycetaceae bacterium]